MIFGVIMLVLIITLTLYIVFNAVQCRKKLILNQYDQHQDYHKSVTLLYSKMTLIMAISSGIVVLLASLMVKEITQFEPNTFIRGTLFVIIVILTTLGILVFRNSTYNKYLTDNVVSAIAIEYSLSFISGILYAFLITYAIETVLILV